MTTAAGAAKFAMPLEIPGRPKPYVMAHRGNIAHCPENTLASFRRAIDEGADLLETDLHLSADGVFVCIHDATLERTTDGSGPVAARTLAELKQHSAGGDDPAYAAERIPTLAETIALLPPYMVLALELKTDRFLEPEVAVALANQLAAAGMTRRTVALSFNLYRVQTVHAAEPEIPAGFITLKRPTPRPGADLLGPFWPLLIANPFYVRTAHRRGQVVCPLDPTPEPRLGFYRRLGVDAVLTNDPGKTLRALGRG